MGSGSNTRAALFAGLTAALAAAPALAVDTRLPRTPSERIEAFQTCAGRLSALMEHQWLVSPADSDATLALRDRFDGLVDAVLHEALDWGVPAAMPMHWRIMAKAQQRDLLSTATFDLDPDRAARAAALARDRIDACRSYLGG